ncbi:MAG: hypothetical protein IPP14_03255 [Planctomycetes bacterium]|nr:hypothetical protein [Planctomycetota bacterium]
MTLVSGRTYEVAVTTDAFFYNSAPPASFQPTGVISYIGGFHDGGAGTYPNTSNGSFLWGVADIGYTTGPSVSTSTSSLNLGSTPSGTASSALSYTVSGASLTANTTITAPTGVEVSFSQTTGFANSIVITTFPTYSGTTIWARIKSTASVGSVSGNITHASTGATTANVAVSGNVTGPTVSPSVSTLNLGSTPQGTVGTPASYTVSGSALTGNTTITAPSGVEVSLLRAAAMRLRSRSRPSRAMPVFRFMPA